MNLNKWNKKEEGFLMRTDEDNGKTDYLEQAFRTIQAIQNDKLANMDRLFHLLEELTEITDRTVFWLIGYCDEHNIPLCREQQLMDYVKLSRMVMTEIGKISSDVESSIKHRLSDEFLHGNKSDEDLTEPPEENVISLYFRKNLPSTKGMRLKHE